MNQQRKHKENDMKPVESNHALDAASYASAAMDKEHEPEIEYSIENVCHFIRRAEMQTEAAKEMLNVMEKKMEHDKQATVDKWYPPHEGWAVGSTYIAGPHSTEANDSDARSNALLWPTIEDANDQLDRDIFFRRLCALAADLQDGKVGGEWEVATTDGGWVVLDAGAGGLAGLFNSAETAFRAAEIMNRDGWKMPAGLGGVE